MGCGILVPHPGIKPTPPALEGGVLATEPPGKSLYSFLEMTKLWRWRTDSWLPEAWKGGKEGGGCEYQE